MNPWEKILFKLITYCQIKNLSVKTHFWVNEIPAKNTINSEIPKNLTNNIKKKSLTQSISNKLNYCLFSLKNVISCCLQSYLSPNTKLKVCSQWLEYSGKINIWMFAGSQFSSSIPHFSELLAANFYQNRLKGFHWKYNFLFAQSFCVIRFRTSGIQF